MTVGDARTSFGTGVDGAGGAGVVADDERRHRDD